MILRFFLIIREFYHFTIENKQIMVYTYINMNGFGDPKNKTDGGTTADALLSVSSCRRHSDGTAICRQQILPVQKRLSHDDLPSVYRPLRIGNRCNFLLHQRFFPACYAAVLFVRGVDRRPLSWLFPARF